MKKKNLNIKNNSQLANWISYGMSAVETLNPNGHLFYNHCQKNFISNFHFIFRNLMNNFEFIHM